MKKLPNKFFLTLTVFIVCILFLVGCGKNPPPEPNATEYSDLRWEDGVNFQADVNEMSFSFFGAPSGKLAKFGLVDANGTFYELGLESNEFKDGDIKTKFLGIVRGGKPAGMNTSMSYALTEAQVLKARSFLAEQRAKYVASSPPPTSDKRAKLLNDDIHDAARDGDLGKAGELLKDSPELVSSKDQHSDTPLHLAAWRGQRDVAKLLLASKADVNARNDFSDTPLHLAAWKGQTDVVKLLLGSKADVNARNDIGQTPLHYAAKHGCRNVVKLLLTRGADANAKANNGGTPLHYAAANGYKDVAELLLASKADVNAKSSGGETPLRLAADYKDLAELLRQHGGHE
jgi:ankyrin repeat protein